MAKYASVEISGANAIEQPLAVTQLVVLALLLCII